MQTKVVHASVTVEFLIKSGLFDKAVDHEVEAEYGVNKHGLCIYLTGDKENLEKLGAYINEECTIN